MRTRDWEHPPKKKTTPREHAIITPEKTNPRQPRLDTNLYNQINKNLIIEDLKLNKVVQHIIRQQGGQRDNLSVDSHSTADSDTDSMSTMDKENDTPYEDLISQLESIEQGSTNTNQ